MQINKATKRKSNYQPKKNLVERYHSQNNYIIVKVETFVLNYPGKACLPLPFWKKQKMGQNCDMPRFRKTEFFNSHVTRTYKSLQRRKNAHLSNDIS